MPAPRKPNEPIRTLQLPVMRVVERDGKKFVERKLDAKEKIEDRNGERYLCTPTPVKRPLFFTETFEPDEQYVSFFTNPLGKRDWEISSCATSAAHERIKAAPKIATPAKSATVGSDSSTPAIRTISHCSGNTSMQRSITQLFML